MRSICLQIPLFLFLSAIPASAVSEPLAPPPQDGGLPYTRSAQPAAIDKIRQGIAVFAGSRYGYFYGNRVRLSETDLLRAEAILRDGILYVPGSFAGLIGLGEAQPPSLPADLAAIADRWVYSPKEILAGRAVPSLTGVAKVDIQGAPYYSFADLAKVRGLQLSTDSRGLFFAGKEALVFGKTESALHDSVVTLFDTPDKLADPDIATRSIPILKRQGKWTDHVKVTPKQLALLEGPETAWEWTKETKYETKGINLSLFGSKVPAPGVYPRLLLSPDDIPATAKRVKSTELGQRSLIEMEHLFQQSWWDPSTSDGGIFVKLSSGQLDGLEWEFAADKPFFDAPHLFKGQKPGIYSSHVAYVPECLTSMGLYALLNEDDILGRKVAAAVANYYKLREPLLDRWLKISDSEFGSSVINPDGSLTPVNASGTRTHWRNIHGIIAHMNLALSLEFSGKWMNAEEKDLMQRVIAKATYGRRSHGQDGPVRVRDVNWMAWDLTHFLAVAAIEGLPGFDPEAYEAGRESVRAFCEWGIDPQGVIFESNGKNPGAFQFQFLSMMIMARRGDNVFAHPHWRRLLEGQVQMTSPNGRVIPNSGTQYVRHSRQRISLPLAIQLKSIYPESRLPDYLATAAVEDPLGEKEDSVRHMPVPHFNPQTYRAQVKTWKRLRLPSPSYPGFVRGVLFDSDLVPTTRKELDLPLDFDAPVHGVFSAYSDRSPEAVWMNLMVRPNHYLGAGHHHADAGMFHFSALGVDWFTESPFTQYYTGNVHNLVLVDGKSESDGSVGTVANVTNGYNAPGQYLGATQDKHVSMVAADLTYAYSWRWNTQPPQVWSEEMESLPWEMDPSPEIAKIFAGTARMKWRPWWPNHLYSNYIATTRAPFNPMEHVFRTTGLVRGKHSYGFVIDDLKKDGSPRLYQWAAMLNGGVWQAEVAGLPAHAVALASTGIDTDLKSKARKPALKPGPGDPLLLVYALGLDQSGDPALPLMSVETVEGPPSKTNEAQYLDRLVINRRAVSVQYRVLFLPLRMGEPLPSVAYDASAQTATVRWADRVDTHVFSTVGGERTHVKITTASPN
jgi:hypothetical protein